MNIAENVKIGDDVTIRATLRVEFDSVIENKDGRFYKFWFGSLGSRTWLMLKANDFEVLP